MCVSVFVSTPEATNDYWRDIHRPHMIGKISSVTFIWYASWILAR